MPRQSNYETAIESLDTALSAIRYMDSELDDAKSEIARLNDEIDNLKEEIKELERLRVEALDE